MLRISGVGVSHVGLVRSGNEDSGFVGPTCMLVADGVGGAAAGEVASATAAYVVAAHLLTHHHEDPAVVLRAAVLAAQQQIVTGVLQDPARAGMATTLTAVATDGHRVALAHVGDSRGFLFRDGSMRQLTIDHTYVQRLVHEGTITEAEAAHHPWRHVVLRSLNGDLDEPGDIVGLDLVPGDRVLLASDGLTDLVAEHRIEELLAANSDDGAAQALVDEALTMGGRDNVTCLVATIIDGPEIVADGALIGAVRDPRNVVDVGAVRMPHSA